MNPECAKKIVRTYMVGTLHIEEEFDVYIVWQCKTLQNWKFLLATTLEDGRYFELTYNGDRRESYLDMYMKEDNVVVTTL